MATLLRVLIDQRGWGEYGAFLHEYSKAARSLARETGDASLATLTISVKTFERWYLGKVTPQNEARRVLARLFQRPITQLLAEAQVEAGPGTAAPVKVQHERLHVTPDADLQRMGRNAAMASRRAITFAMGAEQNEVGPETLSYLQEEIRRITGIYVRVPLSEILDDLVHLQDSAFRLIESGQARPSQIRDLYLMSALTSGMLAKACHDLGDPHSAMSHARAASVCANQAEHSAMSAWVRGLQSLISYWADRPEDALHYACQGTATAPDFPGSVCIWLAGLEARASAALGDYDTVQAANRRAAELREATTPDDLDDLGGIYYYPEIKHRYYEVESNVLLGNGGTELIQRAEDAVQGFSDHENPHWAFGDEAGSQSNLALARLYSGDVEGAADAVQPVLALPPGQRNHGIISSAQRVRTALTTDPIRNAVTARDLREQIVAFSSHPTLALPR
ncbi:hypothetical protein [Streptomyces sp. NPDC004134]|uniref:hypothetical protein n=1 Tax=Streptomyces sp. NPDC004134 TaxID=3364691 RepID=UPI0036BB73E4